MKASPHFDTYRELPEFPARPPKFLYQDNPDEAEDLSSDPGALSLEEADSNTGVTHCDVTAEDDEGYWIHTSGTPGKYLWLVRPDDVKIVLEEGPPRRSVTGGRVKHTNLTAGDAHCGGELWFQDDQAVYINGGSGRFKPRGGAELEAIAEAFRSAGYRVCSFGWAQETNQENRVLRKADIQWK